MTNDQETPSPELYVPVILAVLFILFVAALVWITQIKPIADQVAAERATAAARAEEVADTAAEPGAPVDLEAVTAAINAGGCVACHTIPGISGAVGQVGPDLTNIGVEAASRRDGYTAEAYIHESIVEPNAFIVPDCPTGPCIAGTMPVLPLEEAQLEVIVNYLLTLGN